MDPLTQQHDFGRVGTPGPGSLMLPGLSHETAAMTRTVLQQNHDLYDIFFTAGGLHNHLSHHILALYSLGAPADCIRTAYELQALTQRPMVPVKRTITEDNWKHHLGDSDMYSAYLLFFAERVETMGAAAAIEKYIFYAADSQMLARCVSGAIHPLIHIGYGVEFALDAIVAEGLAETAVHGAMVAALFPSTWPEHEPPSALTNFAGRLSGSLRLTPKSNGSFFATARSLARHGARRPRAGLSAFTIVASMLEDPNMAAGQVNSRDDSSKLGSAVKNAGKAIGAWCNEWVISEEGGWPEIVEKTEELIWIAVLLLFASSRPGFKQRLDFFIMHGVNSSIFLPPLLEALSPQNRIALLHSHFRVLIGYWVSRGRPALHIDRIMAATAHPLPPETPQFMPGGIARHLAEELLKREKKSEESSKSSESSAAETEEPTTPRASTSPSASRSRSDNGSPSSSMSTSPVDPWLGVVASAADHPDEHLTKLVRVLVYAATLFGTTPPGQYACALKGSDVLDGSVFIRCAGLALETMGWVREGQDPAPDWDRSVLGFEEAWKEEAEQIEAGQKGKGRAVEP